MKKRLLTLCMGFISTLVMAQSPNLDSWQVNTDGTLASYWEETSPGTYELTELTDLADVQSVCYTDDSIWIATEGLTTRMGFYQNPGTPGAQGVIYRMPRNPQEETGTKTEVPGTFSVAVLINGIAIFGNSDATSWSQASGDNVSMGDGIWNGDAWYSEGWTLDSTYGAHPNGDGGTYHTHATPFFLYEDSVGHSPIVGWAFDGYPIYGPFGYSDSLDAGSGIKRMESSYALRSITQRHTLPDGTNLSPPEYGPDVDGTYPLGTYIEDYEYVGTGDLDEHNGRWCVTPEFPGGTYAYFVTTDAGGDPVFPYYIGETYYGVADEGNLTDGSITSVDGSATCIGEDVAAGGDLEDITPDSAEVGSSSVTVTFSFADDVDPSTPPTSVAPDEVTIGGVAGTSISRDAGTGDVTATFNLSSLAVGDYDLVVTFSPPMGSDITYTTENGFKIYAGGGPTAIDDVFLGHVSIYPNPASDNLTIDCSSDIIEVTLIDLQGKVESFESESIDVSGLSSGIYIIQIQTTEGIATSRVVIE